MAKKRGYKFTNKRYAASGVMSTVFGVISLVSLGSAIYLAYLADGAAPVNYGVTGVLVTALAIAGLVLSVLTLRDRDSYKLFGILGAALNGLVMAGISLVLYAGASL